MLSTLTKGQKVALAALVVAIGDLVIEYFAEYEGPLRAVVTFLTSLLGAV